MKYEEVYLNAYESMADVRQSLKKYFEFYNQKETLKTATQASEVGTKRPLSELKACGSIRAPISSRWDIIDGRQKPTHTGR